MTGLWSIAIMDSGAGWRYAAAPIVGSDPLKTAIMAVRLGAAKFIVPFIFAYNPTLLLIDVFEPMQFASVLIRTLIAFWLFATVMAGFHRVRLTWVEILHRLCATVLLLLIYNWAQASGMILAILILGVHFYQTREINTKVPA